MMQICINRGGNEMETLVWKLSSSSSDQNFVDRELVRFCVYILKMSSRGVVACSEIPSGAKSSPFNLSILTRKVDLGKDTEALKVRLSQNGEMRLMTMTRNNPESSKNGSRPSNWFWVKAIHLAPDCHVQNVRVCRWQTDSVILQSTRLILPDEELFLWFGEDMLVNDLGISPYLSPQNIRGGKNYTCTKCDQEFEAPNPLKIHLALACGTVSMDTLWTRLAASKPFIPSPLNLHIQSPPPPPISFGFNIRTPYFLPPPAHTHSILRRVHPASTISAHGRVPPIGLTQNALIGITASRPSASVQPDTIAPAQKTAASEHHAHLESIMSNMGRAKNGHHVCIYCGKLYSRKYGLKIHLRTHTGYKPLQCKICQRPFGDPSNLNKHVRLHSDGSTPYRCEFCGKVLVRRRDLDRHIRSRHSSSAAAQQ